VFVVDAYTRRILERHELIGPRATYEEIREVFEQSLGPLPDGLLDPELAPRPSAATTSPHGSCHPPSRMSTAQRPALTQIFNEMHGLMVGVGKNYCKKSQPACEQCPLKSFLPGAQ